MNHVLEELERLLLVDRQCVTYKWLSYEFQISMSKAKEILGQLLKQKGHNGEFDAVYLVSGEAIGADPGSHVVRLVTSEGLDEALLSMKSILSKHVYSLQPNSTVKSPLLWNKDNEKLIQLVALDDQEFLENKFGSVIFNGMGKVGSRRVTTAPSDVGINFKNPEKTVCPLSKTGGKEKRKVTASAFFGQRKTSSNPSEKKQKTETSKPSKASPKKTRVEDTEIEIDNNSSSTQKKSEVLAQVKSPVVNNEDEAYLSDARSTKSAQMTTKKKKARVIDSDDEEEESEEKKIFEKRKKELEMDEEAEKERIKQAKKEVKKAEKEMEKKVALQQKKADSLERLGISVQSGEKRTRIVKKKKTISQTVEDDEGFLVVKQIIVEEDVEEEIPEVPVAILPTAKIPSPTKTVPKKQGTLSMFFKKK